MEVERLLEILANSLPTTSQHFSLGSNKIPNLWMLISFLKTLDILSWLSLISREIHILLLISTRGILFITLGTLYNSRSHVIISRRGVCQSNRDYRFFLTLRLLNIYIYIKIFKKIIDIIFIALLIQLNY